MSNSACVRACSARTSSRKALSRLAVLLMILPSQCGAGDHSQIFPLNARASQRDAFKCVTHELEVVQRFEQLSGREFAAADMHSLMIARRRVDVGEQCVNDLSHDRLPFKRSYRPEPARRSGT